MITKEENNGLYDFIVNISHKLLPSGVNSERGRQLRELSPRQIPQTRNEARNSENDNPGGEPEVVIYRPLCETSMRITPDGGDHCK